MKVITFCLLVCFSFSLAAQTLDDSWTLQSGGIRMDHGKAVTTDPSGNLYVTGGFQGSAGFGTKPLIARGSADIFLAKYSPNGNLMWATQAGGDASTDNTLSEYGHAILVDGNSVYVTGIYLSTARFGDQSIVSKGDNDIFLAKYSLEGKLIWVKSAGGSLQDLPYSIASDNYGNIYLTGVFQNVAQLNTTTLSSPASPAAFIAKYDGEGNLVWARQALGNQSSTGKVVRCTDDHLVLAGEFDGSLTLENSHLTTPGKAVFTARYDLDGHLLKIGQINGTESISVEDLLIEDRVYVLGSYSGQIQSGENQVTSSGNSDVFFATYETEDKLAMLKSFGGRDYDVARKLALTENHNLILSGNFQDQMTLGNSTFQSKGGSDIFVACFSKDGEFRSGETFGGENQDQLNDIAFSEGHVYMTGFFRDGTNFKGQAINSKGLSDIMLSKYKPSAEFEEISEPTLYPNPCNDQFRIHSQLPLRSARIFNVLGKQIVEKNFATGESQVNLGGIPPGVYLVRFATSQKMHSAKLIVE